jgi:glucose/arabinose dehydrogenase
VFRRTLRSAIIVGLLAPASASAAVIATPIGGGFSAPTYITAPPGNAQQLFVVEQSGVIKLIDLGSPATSTTFLDISSEVEFTGGEQGLLSMAFAPDYATSRRFYLYYTDMQCPSSPGCDEQVSEFTANANLQSASPGSEQMLLTIPHPDQSNHNGGQLQFGPDGDLYISVGDGGGGNDTELNAQHTTTLLGKILRIAPGTSSYSIPAGNPFANTTTPPCSTGPSPTIKNCPEIWAYGLRNPWRFSFDSASGDLVIGDVGQDRNEEVDFAHPGQNVGANYGWPCFEGFELNAARPASECSPLPSPVVAPVLTYPHPANCPAGSFCGAGIIGGYVMHDPTLPSLDGCYVFGDLSTSDLRVARLAQPVALGGADLGPQIGNLSSFGEDAAGHLYAADIGSGVVSELTSDGNAATNPTCPPAPVTGGPPPPPSKQLPFNTAAPRILGRVTPGSKLTCTPGSWTAATTFAYQWAIDGSVHAAGTTYRPRNADVGHLLGCVVTATNSDGSRLALSADVRVADHTPPKLAALTLSPAAFRKRAIVRFRLDERATITVTVQRIGRGHKISGSRRVRGKPGVNRFAFTGRIGGHSLAAGRYRLVLRARDRHGNLAKPVRVRFSIRR